MDAERFPPYLPERKGYFKLMILNKENVIATPLSATTVYFAIRSSSLKRFKVIGPN